MKPVVKVVCGIIQKGDTYFIARRRPEKNLGGYWEFPGGKLEENENASDALHRELQEELGMKVGEIQYFGQHRHEYEKFVIELIAFTCDFESATFQLSDHDDYAFVEKNEFHKYMMAPADLFIIENLSKR